MQYQFSFQGKIQNEEAYKSRLNTSLTTENMKENELNNAINTNDASIELDEMNLEQYKDLLKLTEEDTPLNRMYSDIKVWKLDGMCGMSMGNMGHWESSCMQLTGQELRDISELLKSNEDGRYKPEDLAAKLSDKGHNVSAGEGTSIVLTREDGSQVKFCDANGDGQLNCCDYDFDAALAKLDADMQAWEAKIESIKDKIASLENNIETKTEENEDLTDQRDDSVEKQEGIEEEIETVDENIEDLENKQREYLQTHELELAKTESERTSKFSDLLKQVQNSKGSSEEKLGNLNAISGANSEAYHKLYGIYVPTDISAQLESWNNEEQQLKDYADSIGVEYNKKVVNNFKAARTK